MRALNLNLKKQRHFVAALRSYQGIALFRHTLFYTLACIVLLLCLDQGTKMCAMTWAPPARKAMCDSALNFAFGWHIHEPNAHANYLAIMAFSLAAAIWCLPVPMAAKILWTAAALSNHVEMLMRPGTVDFLAVRFGGNIWVANVADIYVVAGMVLIIAAMYKRIMTAPSWFAPVVS
jgi:lipoprotein signal peptidase